MQARVPLSVYTVVQKGFETVTKMLVRLRCQRCMVKQMGWWMVCHLRQPLCSQLYILASLCFFFFTSVLCFTVYALLLLLCPARGAGGIKRWCASDVWRRLSVAYIGPSSRTERPRKTKIGTEIAHVTRDSDHFQGEKVKGQLARGRGHVVATSHTAYFACYLPWGD